MGDFKEAKITWNLPKFSVYSYKSVYSLSVWSEMRVGLWYWGSHIFLFLRCKVCL